MRQVLFEIPLHSWLPFLPNLPIFGYGMMLFFAFVFCSRLAVRLAKREGYSREIVQDMTIWIFILGIIGARITFYIQYRHEFASFWQIFAIWDGGLVFYGSMFGGVAGYFLVSFLYLRKRGVSDWKMADILAPCIALGLALGRVGCLLNGCCYGNVAVCADGFCPAVSFPLAAQPRMEMTRRGYQTAAGFTLNSRNASMVEFVEPGSAAERGGLRAGDVLLKVNDNPVVTPEDIVSDFVAKWPRGQNELTLDVEHAAGGVQSLTFAPWSIGLHPTQIYETISMVLLLFFLLSYYPYKRYDGSVMIFLMLGYGVHRFLDEMLRTDNETVAFGMTLSQIISILVLVAAVLLAAIVLYRGPHKRAPLRVSNGDGRDDGAESLAVASDAEPQPL